MRSGLLFRVFGEPVSYSGFYNVFSDLVDSVLVTRGARFAVIDPSTYRRVCGFLSYGVCSETVRVVGRVGVVVDGYRGVKRSESFDEIYVIDTRHRALYRGSVIMNRFGY